MTTFNEGARITVGQLGIEHHGWYVALDRLETEVSRTHVVLGGVRRWTYEGVSRVGVLDTSTKAPGINGTEHMRAASDMCTLERRVVKTKPRARQYDEVAP